MILPHRIYSIRVVADEASYEYLSLRQRLTDPIEARIVGSPRRNGVLLLLLVCCVELYSTRVPPESGAVARRCC
jgi:hypothetical protein